MSDTVFQHVALTCREQETMEAFYTRHFGFRRARVFAPGPGQIVMLRSGDVMLALFKAAEDSPLPPAGGNGPAYPGWKHICFAVADLEAKLNEMGDEARITLGPLNRDELEPGMRVAWIADPEGNIIELCQGFADDPDCR